MEIAGKTALITGATGGLGRAIAAALADRGAILVLSARREDELRELAGSLPGHDHRIAVSDLQREGAAEQLMSEAGDVDVIVANAAVPGTGRVEQYTAEQVARAVRVNLEAPIQMARCAIPALTRKADGHIVLVGSLNSKVATPRSAIYAATKFGLRGFALALREDLWGTGVGVSIVMPGFVREAGMFHDSGAKPPPGLGTTSPREVAEAVVSAIERNRGEIEVAPRLQRIAAGFAHRRPGLAAAITRGNAGKIADELADGQSSKR